VFQELGFRPFWDSSVLVPFCVSAVCLLCVSVCRLGLFRVFLCFSACFSALVCNLNIVMDCIGALVVEASPSPRTCAVLAALKNSGSFCGNQLLGILPGTQFDVRLSISRKYKFDQLSRCRADAPPDKKTPSAEFYHRRA
jgi:hypothetical protein